MAQLTDKEKNILNCQKRPFGCTVAMPPGMMCSYRAVYEYEIKKHTKSHKNAIANNLKNNSRNYEISPEGLEALKQKSKMIFNPVSIAVSNQEHLLDQLATRPVSRYTAVEINGNVIYIEQQKMLNMMENRLQQSRQRFNARHSPIYPTPPVTADPSPDTSLVDNLTTTMPTEAKVELYIANESIKTADIAVNEIYFCETSEEMSKDTPTEYKVSSDVLLNACPNLSSLTELLNEVLDESLDDGMITTAPTQELTEANVEPDVVDIVVNQPAKADDEIRDEIASEIDIGSVSSEEAAQAIDEKLPEETLTKHNILDNISLDYSCDVLLNGNPNMTPPILLQNESVSDKPAIANSICPTPPSSSIAFGIITPLKERPYYINEASNEANFLNGSQYESASESLNDSLTTTTVAKTNVDIDVVNELVKTDDEMPNVHKSPNKSKPRKSQKDSKPKKAKKKEKKTESKRGNELCTSGDSSLLKSKLKRKSRRKCINDDSTTPLATTASSCNVTAETSPSEPQPGKLSSDPKTEMKIGSKRGNQSCLIWASSLQKPKRKHVNDVGLAVGNHDLLGDILAQMDAGAKKKADDSDLDSASISGSHLIQNSRNSMFAEYINGNLGDSEKMANKIVPFTVMPAVSEDYSRLSLAPFFDTYSVPDHIEEVERKGDCENTGIDMVSLILKFGRMRSNKNLYFEGRTLQLHFEEAVESAKFYAYKCRDVSIRPRNEEKERASNSFLLEIDDQTSKLIEAIDDKMLSHFTLKTSVKSYQQHNSGQKFNQLAIAGQISLVKNESIFVNLCADIETLNCLREQCSKDFGQLALNLNEEQKRAVRNITNRSSGNLPYLLIGPPGTGKTRTLVSAIEEIIWASDVNNVLVCSNSNAVCDEILERLIPIFSTEGIIRLYTSSYDKKKMDPRFESYSNYRRSMYTIPSLRELYNFRVIICTLAVAGNLTRANNDRLFDTAHFSHIIMDESACTHETMTMIPIAGLCTVPGEVKSTIVLSGDPKQLDAVTNSNYAKKLGFSTSFMEILSEKELYQPNPTGKYNANFITHLIRNYRSHENILKIPNTLFYRNQLIPEASEETVNWFVGPHLKFVPIVFQSVEGVQKSGNSTSSYNSEELEMVAKFVESLLSSNNPFGKSVKGFDIGIVTPYKEQHKRISQRFEENSQMADILIGTAEIFQGKEKPVMIISTVSVGKVTEFMRDDRRTNVMLTRAKCLEVIIGHAKTLRGDKNWNEMIEYCKKLGCFYDSQTPFL